MFLKNKVGWWFLGVGLLIILIAAVDLVSENYVPKAKLLSEVIVDGKIKPGEYTHHFFDGKIGYKLYWRIIGKNIYFALHSPKKGWVAIGLGATQAMHNADIYMGYVKNGKVYMEEEYGNTPYSHVPLSSLSAKPVIEKYAGSVNASGTTIEFERPLEVNSKYAKSITNKTIKVIFAFSNAKNFTTYHGSQDRGITRINFFAKTTAKKSSGLGMWVKDLKSYQIAFLVWGVLFLLVSFIAFVTGLIEGTVETPMHIKKNYVSSGPFVTLIVLGGLDIFFVLWFIIALFSKATPTLRGFLFSIVLFILAIMVALYKRYFIDEEVIEHDLDDQLPW